MERVRPQSNNRIGHYNINPYHRVVLIYVSRVDRNTEEIMQRNLSRRNLSLRIWCQYSLPLRSLAQEGHKPILMEASNLPTAC